MKTSNKLIVFALIASAGLLGARISTAQPIDSVESLKNSALAASPRAKELFPWLTRTATIQVTPAKPSDVRGFAASPKMLEQFPELSRPAQALKKDSSVPSALIENRGFASTPRAKEEFPWLDRGSYRTSEKPVEIAPLK